MADDTQRAIAKSIGVPVARRHIFLCCDQTKPKCCDKDRGLAAWDFLKGRLKELGLSEQGGILRTKANCLRICEGGPIAVVYPEGAWYGAAAIRPCSNGSSRSISSVAASSRTRGSCSILSPPKTGRLGTASRSAGLQACQWPQAALKGCATSRSTTSINQPLPENV